MSYTGVASEFNNPKYDAAKKTAIEAGLKQTGLENDFLMLKGAAEGKGRKLLKDAGVEKAAGVIGFTYLVVKDRKVRTKYRNLILEVTQEKSLLTWRVQF